MGSVDIERSFLSAVQRHVDPAFSRVTESPRHHARVNYARFDENDNAHEVQPESVQLVESGYGDDESVMSWVAKDDQQNVEPWSGHLEAYSPGRDIHGNTRHLPVTRCN